MNPTFEIAASERNKDIHKIISTVIGDKDLDGVPRYSRANSLFDDSGFSSSASEDRDDVLDGALGQHCACLLEGSIDIAENSTQNSLPTSGIHVCSKLTTSGKRVQSSGNMPLETETINKTNPDENHGSLLSNRIPRSVSLDNINGGDISSRNTGGVSRRQQTFPASSLVSFGTREHRRISINRRLRSRDINNNECGHRNFSSYFKKPPFKLQDCFQDQGLLSLVACITYTIVLMIVFCVIGIILDSIKSLIGAQNLKDMRENIVHSRHPRPAMSSG